MYTQYAENNSKKNGLPDTRKYVPRADAVVLEKGKVKTDHISQLHLTRVFPLHFLMRILPLKGFFIPL